MTTPKSSHSNLNQDPRSELLAQTPSEGELGSLGTLEKTAATLLEGVRRRLLDMSANNRLLNHRATSKTISFLSPDLERLYAELVEEPKSVPVASVVGTGRLPFKGLAEFPDLCLKTDVPEEALEVRLKRIASDGKMAIEETGLNLLYLAFGFLHWSETPGGTTYAAPLLMVPVTVLRVNPASRGAVSRYAIQYDGEDVEPNSCLAEKLRQFRIELPIPDDEPSTNDTPFRPLDYLGQVEDAVSTMAGWTVVPDLVLGFFQFSKLRMHKDLSPDQWEPGPANILAQTLVTDALLGRTKLPGEAVVPEDIDLETHPVAVKMPLVLDADSSQHKVLVDALAGRSMVVHGPPGTGKSQTITNLIVAAMAQGKTVLFVSEKMAALEVVHRNMQKLALHHFCLELHSARATKTRVLSSLRDRLALRLGAPDTIQKDRDRVVELRKKLHIYADAIRKQVTPIDETVYAILGKALSLKSRHSGRSAIQIRDAVEMDQEAVNRRVQALSDLQEVTSQYGPVYKSSWRGIEPSTFRIDTEQTITDAVTAGAVALGQCELHAQGPISCCVSSGNTLKQLVCVAQSMVEMIHACPQEYAEHGFPVKERADRDVLRQFLHALTAFTCEGAILDQRLAGNWRSRLDSAIATATRGNDDALTFLGNVTLQDTDQWLRSLHSVSEALAVVARATSVLSPLEVLIRLDSLPALKLALRVFDHLQRLPAVPDVARLVSACDPRFLGLLSAFHAQGDALLAESHRLAAVVSIDRLPPIDVIYSWRETLALSCSRLLGGGWTRAKRVRMECQKLLRNPSERKNDKEWVGLLSQLLEHLQATAGFDQNECAKALYGGLFAGMHTPWPLLVEIQNWVRTAQDLLGLKVMTDQLLSLSQWPSSCRNDVSVLRDALIVADAAVQGLEELSRRAGSLCVTTTGRLVGQSITRADCECQELCKRISAMVKDARELEANPQLKVAEWGDVSVALSRAAERAREIALSSRAQILLGDWFQGNATDSHALRAALQWHDAVDSAQLPSSAQDLLHHWEPEQHSILLASCNGITQHISAYFSDAFSKLQEIAPIDERKLFGDLHSECSLSCLVATFAACQAESDNLAGWLSYSRIRQEASELGLGAFIERGESEAVPFPSLPSYFVACFYNTLAEHLINASPILLQFVGLQHDGVRKSFAEADSRIKRLDCVNAAASIERNHRVPEGVARGTPSSFTDRGLIEHESRKIRRHLPIRTLVRRAGRAIQGLKPCFMMSPMSVAQFIAPNTLTFDLIVIDEASQLRPEDALGALARGRQVVVVGDPKQLPPTSFFDRYGGEDESEDENPLQNIDSILDSFKGVLPSRMLNWHYRSRHHSLIRFSNARYYGNKLVVFPSPHDRNDTLGLKFHYIRDGHFHGSPGRNDVEAAAIAKAIMEHVHTQPGISLGVAAMSLRQREAIEECLDALMKDDPGGQETLDAFNKSVQDPLFIKNLESVQGDEREVIMVSCTYGRDLDSGRVFQRFGPINNMGGERRLNVLFTRARMRMEIFSSMRSSDIEGGPHVSEGARDLRSFLAYAETGHIPDEGTLTLREPGSDFEVEVGNEIARLGFTTEYQVGVAGFFIDLAVRHPSRPSDFMLGIECDGASYHSSRSARDRDRLREEIIRSRGWCLHRIWSTDWFLRRPQELRRLQSALEAATRAIEVPCGTTAL